MLALEHTSKLEPGAGLHALGTCGVRNRHVCHKRLCLVHVRSRGTHGSHVRLGTAELDRFRLLQRARWVRVRGLAWHILGCKGLSDSGGVPSRRLAGWMVAWQAGRLVGWLAAEAPSGVAKCELRARFDQFQSEPITISIRLSQLSMAVRIGLRTTQKGQCEEVVQKLACEIHTTLLNHPMGQVRTSVRHTRVNSQGA